jgi:hypothetical protein
MSEDMQLLLADVSMVVEEKKKVEEKTKRFEDEKLKIEQSLADIICRQKMKAKEDTLKMKKIKKLCL